MRTGSIVFVLGLVMACDGPRAPGSTTPRVAPIAEPAIAVPPAPLIAPGLRLPRAFAVGSYAATLTLDPAQPTFAGAIEIAGELAAPAAVIWLHAEQLDFDRAVAITAAGEVPLEVVVGLAPGRVALRASAPLPAGRLVLAIRYRGRLAEVDTAGTFRQQVGADWYAFTQHEATFARRSFPCVDEPASKVPWTLTLVVPSGLTAVANAPVVTDQVVGTTRTVRFAATPPLPTYLIAFAVGPFDIVPAGTTAGGAPLRIIALKGRGADAGFAVAATPKLLAALEQWFGTPYPYAKLDSIAIPATVGFGAMENPGLITYRESLLLMPTGASQQRQRRYVGVATHELAHQWFGDLVTPAWWDDLWLNESFASWLPGKIVGQVFPAWDLTTESVEGRNGALEADSLITARRIRQPIATEDDIVTAFDGITYGKGAAVLRMFEERVGAAGFQRGVRGYLAAHAHGTATAADFLGAIAAEAPGLDVIGGFQTFLDQAGAPRISAAIECDGQPRLRVSQRRHVPLGAAPTATAPVWAVPLCVKAGTGATSVTVCTQLTAAEATIALPSCPTWLWPNADANGYYRSGLTGAQWTALIERGWSGLTVRERLAAAGDLVAAISAGDLGIDVGLGLVPKLVAERTRPFLSIAVGLIEGVRPWVRASARPAFARWVTRQLRPSATAVTLRPRADDDPDRERLRQEVVPIVAELGADAGLRKRAVKAAATWRTQPESVRAMIVVIAVRAAPSLHAGLLAEFRAETDRVLRGDLVRALGAAAAPAAVEAALALVLDPSIDIRDSQPILAAALAGEDSRATAAAFAKLHLDELIARVPPQQAAGLVAIFTSGCDASGAPLLRELAEAKLGRLPGAKRRIDQAFERLAQCSARREAMAPALDAWLATLK